MALKGKDPISPQEANDLLGKIFAAAKSRQVFGVNWDSLSDDDKCTYVSGFFGREVWQHQREPLLVLTNSRQKRITYNAARQTGKSELLAWCQALCAQHNTHPALDGKTKVVALANKFSQTQIVANRVRNLLTENYERSQFFWDRDGSTKAHIVFKRERGINSRETGTIDYITANPKAFSEGFTASIAFVDEAGRLDRRVLSEVIIPYLGSTAGSLVLTGVSRGKGAFYDACNSPDYYHLHYPWDKVETYRRSAPADIVFDDGRRMEVGLYPLEAMPLNLKKALFPTNPMVHVIGTNRQEERSVRMWSLSRGTMSEDDFRSQYMLEWLADLLAFFQLQDTQLLFEMGDFEPLTQGIPGEEYYFGLDCGGSRNIYATTYTDKDRAALSVWRRKGQIKQKVFCDERDDVSPDELIAWLRATCHPTNGQFKCRHGAVDVTGAVGAAASKPLAASGIPVIPIFYGRQDEVSKKNYKNAMFDHFRLETGAGHTQYPMASLVDALDERTTDPLFPTFYHHRDQWEKLERKLTTGINSIITAPPGEHDDGPNSDVLAAFAMDKAAQFREILNVGRRPRRAIIGRGTLGPRQLGWYGR